MKSLTLIKKLSFIVCCVLITFTLNGQNSNELKCPNKDFKFLINSNYYLDLSQYYVCPSIVENLKVKIVKSNTLVPISDQIFWKLNSQTSNVIKNELDLKKSFFTNDVLEIKAFFIDVLTGDEVVLTINLSTDLSLLISEKSKNFEFDANTNQHYINSYSNLTDEKLGTPWNFISSSGIETLSLGFNNQRIIQEPIQLKGDNVTVVPGAISPPIDIDVTYSGSTSEKIEIYGCDESQEDLLLYSASSKQLTINFFEVCETDDDNIYYPSGTAVMSHLTVCADGGNDTTFDRGYSPNFAQNDDVRTMQNGIQVILAGPNRICETPIDQNSNGPDCPTSFNYSANMAHLNTMFNKVGVNFNYNVSQTPIYHNYNVYDEIDNGISKREQYLFHTFLHGSGPANSINVYLVSGISSTNGNGMVAGRAQTDESINYDGNSFLIPYNTMVIDPSISTLDVLGHELGHAVYGLLHPGGPGHGQFGYDDEDNFMHGSLSPNSPLKKIKRYQFHLINK